MRTLIGLILACVGGGLIAWAIVGGLSELGAAYEGVLDDPLATPAVEERDRGDRILQRLLPGAVGVPMSIIGGAMLSGLARRRRRRGHLVTEAATDIALDELMKS